MWANSTSNLQWQQIEKIKKRLIINKFKIKGSVPYDIMLSEVGADPTEAITMVRLIKYLKKIEQMEDDRCPKVVFNDILCKRKKTRMQQNNKWLSKWVIYLNTCPTNNKKIKVFVINKFHKQIWGKGMERKKEYYIKSLIPPTTIIKKII